MQKKIMFALGVLIALSGMLFAQNSGESEGSQTTLYTAKQEKLRIMAADVRLVADTKNGGYHLYVKKTANVNSILLTETTKDPQGKNDSYAYRAKEYNKINGDEIRFLDGKKYTCWTAMRKAENGMKNDAGHYSKLKTVSIFPKSV